MKNIYKYILLVSTVVLSMSCVTMGSKDQDVTTLELSNTNSSLVYFYRINSFIGMLVDIEVLMDRNELGTLSISDSFIKELKPGKHQFVVKVAGDGYSWSGRLTNEFKAGETYYIRIKGTNLELVSMEQGLKDIKKIKRGI